MNNYAPVLICTLNRHIHFKRCVESLAASTYANKSDLFIGLDYPSNDTHWAGYEIIKAYLPTITGFKTVNIVAREKNFGVTDNWSGMIEYVFERYDRIILSEDDNVFAKSFLSFINGGLCNFEKDPLVLAICGYKFPFDIPKSFPYNFFYSKGFSGWGFGTWRNKYIAQHWNNKSIKEIEKYMRKPWKALFLNSYQYGLFDGLVNIVDSGKFTGDRMYCFSNLVNGTYSVFPTVSKVRNTGHDGSGVHSTKMERSENIFINQLVDSETTLTYRMHHEYENKIIGAAFKKHHRNYNYLRFHYKIIFIFKYIKFLLSH